jgi:hypothetical protein
VGEIDGASDGVGVIFEGQTATKRLADPSTGKVHFNVRGSFIGCVLDPIEVPGEMKKRFTCQLLCVRTSTGTSVAWMIPSGPIEETPAGG